MAGIDGPEKSIKRKLEASIDILTRRTTTLVKRADIGYKSYKFCYGFNCKGIHMPVEIIYKNRRQGANRRKSLSTDQVSERRSGLERRKLDEKLKQLIESDIKD